MVEKFAQAGQGGEFTPTPFLISTMTNKVVVYTPAESDPLFILYPYV